MHYNEIVKVEYAFGWEEKLEEWGNFRYNHSTKLYETSLHARQFMSGQRWSGDGEKKNKKESAGGAYPTLFIFDISFPFLFFLYFERISHFHFKNIYIYTHTRTLKVCMYEQ